MDLSEIAQAASGWSSLLSGSTFHAAGAQFAQFAYIFWEIFKFTQLFSTVFNFFLQETLLPQNTMSNRPERWIITIPSSDQWLATIGNHWKTIATNGFGDQKPLKNH